MTNWVNGPWNPDGNLPVPFKALPKFVYRDDPQWIPESANNLDAMFSRKNTFFGEHDAWLGVVPDRTRLAGFFYNDQSPDEQKTAYFGYFEAIDDVNAASSLFQDFEAWARDKGATQIIGPINFSTYHSNRVRLDNFDANPFFPGEPYNPAYYEPLLTALGYVRFHEYKSWFGDGATIVENLRNIITRVTERTEKQGFTITTLSPEYWMDNLRAMYDAVDEIFSVGLAYRPISWDLFEQNYGLPMAKKIDPNCSFLVLNTEGQMAAFTLSFPDYGELLHQGGAHRMNPADIEFERHFDLLKKRLCIAKTVGVRPKHQRLGLFEIMCFKAAEASLEHYDRTSVALIRTGNLSDRSATKVYSASDCTTNTYGLFSKEIAIEQ